MELYQLMLFKTVAELEHMTKASNVLHIAQPALSKTIKKLEEELGLPLFMRSGKRITLNENGKILLNCANDIQRRLDTMRKELTVDNENCRKRIVVSMLSAVRHLPMLIVGFKERFPDINIQIVQFYNNDSYTNWDVCIMASRMELKIPNYMPLLEEEMLLALPKGHPLFERDSVELTEVINDSFICMRKDYVQREIFDSYCKMAGFTPNVALEIDNQYAVMGLLEQGIGIAMIPHVSWLESNSGTVHLARISNPVCTRHLGIRWRNRSFSPQYVELFRDYVLEYFEKFKLESIR